MKEKTCLALYSGGLDSMLAVKVMQEQGIKVMPLNFNTGFFFHAYIIENARLKYKKKTPPGVEVEVIDISKEFFEMIRKPSYGFGRNMNPCIDCKILMLRKAKELMPAYDAGFVITGEVLGQRPMTQNSHSMKIIEKQSGLEGYLIRPLCAKNMEETEPEKLGWVDRNRLLDIKGRSRKEQMRLARIYNIEGYAQQPAGGCILTETSYSKRLEDFIQHNGTKEILQEDMLLLATGRHFRKGNVKFIIGRNSRDNDTILLYGKKTGAKVFDCIDAPGPIAITFDEIDNEMKGFIAGAVASYSDIDKNKEANVDLTINNNKETLKVMPIDRQDLLNLRIDKE